MTAYRKTQAASKRIEINSTELDRVILETMRIIAQAVGATLGPGGCPVMVERQEFGTSPLITKDGVTVVQSLGFEDPVAQSLFESVRDAATRTVAEAGDGTTTATILSYGLVRGTQEFRRAHPGTSPQRIVQAVQKLFRDAIEPGIMKWRKTVDFSTPEGKKVCRSVATVSANGEEALADAVMQAFDLIGDKGNVVLSEKNGPGGYEVEQVDGYPIATGCEDSCGRWWTAFINDPHNSRVFLEKPVVLLYNGVITDIATMLKPLSILQNALNSGSGVGPPMEGPKLTHPGVVVVANGFSDAVIGNFHTLWTQGSLKVYPVVTPKSAMSNGETLILENLAAQTGARIFNPASIPFDSVQEYEQDADGTYYELPWLGRAEEFEALRFRSSLIGIADEDAVLERASVLEGMAATALSELDRRIIDEAKAALIGGIAKLYVVGCSIGEIRERKDRCDDAVRAVQGALKAGVLPGGCWTLLKLARLLGERYKGEDTIDLVAKEVVIPALREPFLRLLRNIGMTNDEIASIEPNVGTKKDETYDAANGKMVNAFKVGLLDSVPAVLEAIRNSNGIATLLGTLGAVVVFRRDAELERAEARSATCEYDGMSSTEIANNRI